MTAHLYAHGISYFSVPKCACTSFKMMFFEMENKFPFQDFSANGMWFHIHRFYISTPFETSRRAAQRNPFRFTVIRSPKERLESCYKHWVASPNGKKLMLANKEDLSLRDAPAEPSWEEFIEYLNIYRETLPNIEHHTQPLSYFLGKEPEYFDEIYSLKNISQCISTLEEKTNLSLNLSHHNISEGKTEMHTKKRKIPEKDGTEKLINDMYKEDFDLYQEYF